MEQKISRKKLEAFIVRHPFPDSMGWESLLHCLFGKQSCENLTQEQQGDVRLLLKVTMDGSVFSKSIFTKTVKTFDRILNGPYLRELQQAIEETNTLIRHFSEVSGRQIGAVDGLEKLALKTVQSDQSPQEMVSTLKGAFQNLVALMEEDAKLLKQLSKTDQLTGLANRRGFDEYLHHYCQPDKGQSLHLIMIDIDYFKDFNDEYGHLVGDEVLTLVAGIIAKVMKGSDASSGLTARYGGEEFAIITPSGSELGCLALAEDLRSRIEHYPVVIRNSTGDIIKKDVHLTVSVGVASMHPLWLKDQENSSHLLIQAADQAMYEAKKRGRNMICQHKAYKGANGNLTSVIL